MYGFMLLFCVEKDATYRLILELQYYFSITWIKGHILHTGKKKSVYLIIFGIFIHNPSVIFIFFGPFHSADLIVVTFLSKILSEN